MRFEITIPDDASAELQAKFVALTKRLTATPDLVREIELDGDDAIQRMFTAERLAHIDQALAQVDSGQFFSSSQVDEHFRRRSIEWAETQNR